MMTFKDPNLKTAIHRALGIGYNEPITTEMMLRLTVLDAQCEDIENLDGLEYFTNLVILYLYGNRISDISALAHLTNLTNLDLSKNRIRDIRALSGLTRLVELDLRRNRITDISALAGLLNLTDLWLQGNPLDYDSCPEIRVLRLRGVYVYFLSDL